MMIMSRIQDQTKYFEYVSNLRGFKQGLCHERPWHTEWSENLDLFNININLKESNSMIMIHVFVILNINYRWIT